MTLSLALTCRTLRNLLQQVPGGFHEGGIDGILLDLGVSSMQVSLAA